MLTIAAGYILAVYAFRSKETAQAWFTGYILECALSLDDLFTFHLIFLSFGVPNDMANLTLSIALYAAMVLRSALILCFAALFQLSYAVNVIVGCCLISGAILMEFSGPDEE